MVIVTMRQTMQAAILMVGTVVETTLTPNIVMNVFVINKLECLKTLHAQKRSSFCEFVTLSKNLKFYEVEKNAWRNFKKKF